MIAGSGLLRIDCGAFLDGTIAIAVPGRSSAQENHRNCKLCGQAARKSRDQLDYYEVALRHCLSRTNSCQTGLPVAGEPHVRAQCGDDTIAPGGVSKGASLKPVGSFRPAHNSSLDTRQQFFGSGSRA
jgi:hypothetical protein